MLELSHQALEVHDTLSVIVVRQICGRYLACIADAERRTLKMYAYSWWGNRLLPLDLESRMYFFFLAAYSVLVAYFPFFLLKTH